MFAGPLGRSTFTPPKSSFDSPLYGLVSLRRSHSFQFRNLTVDHVTPQSQGGTDHMENLQLLCGACNSMKGTGTQAELIVKLQAQELR